MKSIQYIFLDPYKCPKYFTNNNLQDFYINLSIFRFNTMYQNDSNFK